MSKNNERRKSGVFIVEGVQENERAIQFGYTPTEFFICNDIFQGNIPSAVINNVSARFMKQLHTEELQKVLLAFIRKNKIIRTLYSKT
jgi:hypothetical protein